MDKAGRQGLPAYGLIGMPLGHSLSRQLHARFGTYDYALHPLAPAELGVFLAARRFAGLNVTLPYKQAVLPYLDEIDPQAAAIGAVNTIVNRGGRLCGYNTDLGGLLALLRREKIALGGKKVLILGTGGTASTALAAARQCHAAQVLLVSRTEKPGAVTYAAALRAHTDAQVLINTTPVGMAPDTAQAPITLAPFARLEAVVDVIYNPLRTRLCLAPLPQGASCRRVNGLYMLVQQAALSCELFTGTAVSPALVEDVYRSLRMQRENLVLIGMPGSGKTTVGRLLAEKTGRPFYDSDEALALRTGHTAAALLHTCGEARFRALEAETIRALAAQSGCVIATGGGAVLDAENVVNLKQNGRLFFLDRPLRELAPASDRPLSDTPEKLRQLFAARRPRYLSAADETLRIEGGSAADYADAILARM